MLTVEQILNFKNLKQNYTMEEVKQLSDNSRKYEENFQNMVNFRNNRKYAQKEVELNLKDIRFRKNLGIYVEDGCPVYKCRFKSKGKNKVCPNLIVQDGIDFCTLFKMEAKRARGRA